MDKILYLTKFFPPIAAGIFCGLLISISLWTNPKNFPLKRDDRKRCLIIIFSATVLAAGIATGLFYYEVSEKIIGNITIISLLCIVIRFARLKSKNKPSNRLILGFTLLDIILFHFTLEFLEVWLKAILTKGMLSSPHILGFPFFYLLILTYVIFNYDLIDRQKVKLAAWRLNAYSFPECKNYRPGIIRKTEPYNARMTEILKWSLMLFVIVLGFLFGYWLTSYAWTTIFYFVLFIIMFGIVILKGGWKYKKKDLRGIFTR